MDSYIPVNIAGAPYTNNSIGSSANQLSLPFLDARYLDVAGGDKMLVNLDAGNFNVINVLDPVNPQDSATKNYVDSSGLKFLAIAGTNNMTGKLNAGNFNVTNVLDPVNPQDSATKNYVDTSVNTKSLLVSGTNKMLASLNVGNNNVMNVSDPVADQDAVTKRYVDYSFYTSALTALFPVLTSNTSVTSSGTWIASASSEYFDGLYPAYKVTTNNDWATNAVSTNYWVQIQVPSSIAVSPVQIALKA